MAHAWIPAFIEVLCCIAFFAPPVGAHTLCTHTNYSPEEGVHYRSPNCSFLPFQFLRREYSVAQSHDRVPDESLVSCGYHSYARFSFLLITGSSKRTKEGL